MTGRLPLVALIGLVPACGSSGPESVKVSVGAHRVSFAVPDGFQHYDHAREQRLESGDGDIVLTDLGPVTAEGYLSVVKNARELFLRGRREDAKQVLGRLDPFPGIDDHARWRPIADALLSVSRDAPDAEIVQAFDTASALLEDLPPSDFRALADRALQGLGHGPRRDVEREEKLLVDGRPARRIVTWQRMTHDVRRRYVFVVNRGHLLVIRTGRGLDEALAPAFSAVVRSLRFLEPGFSEVDT